MLLQRPGEDTLPSFSLPVCLRGRGRARARSVVCALWVSVCRLGASAFSSGLGQTSVYHVLIIVLGHESHKGILPPCKLILRYYQFTSATLWKWKLARESDGKVTICFEEIISFKSVAEKKPRKAACGKSPGIRSLNLGIVWFDIFGAIFTSWTTTGEIICQPAARRRVIVNL